MYKFSPDFYEKINQIKKKRKKYNLLNYQNNLLNTINDNFSKEHFKKLEKKFLGLRNYSFHKIILNREFIEKIEKKAINKWNTKSQKLGVKRSAEMIQKNLRIYLYKKKQ